MTADDALRGLKLGHGYIDKRLCTPTLLFREYDGVTCTLYERPNVMGKLHVFKLTGLDIYKSLQILNCPIEDIESIALFAGDACVSKIPVTDEPIELRSGDFVAYEGKFCLSVIAKRPHEHMRLAVNGAQIWQELYDILIRLPGAQTAFGVDLSNGLSKK